MKEVLYIDPIAGASGDMFLGALVDLGVDFEELRDGLRKLDVRGFDLIKSATKRHEIAATKVDVVVEDVPNPHRHLSDLLKIVAAATLPDAVKDLSTRALTRLAEAEARVHRMDIAKVHLHEVGGLDCLVDVVGTMLGVHLLGVEAIFSGPVSVGAGFVKCAHGVMPVPVPGSLAILEGFPIRRVQFPYEMTTPTGATLLATLATPVIAPFVMVPRVVGYGAGSRDTADVANLLRLIRADVDPRVLAQRAHSHSHEHQHDHSQDHAHEHAHDHEHEHPHHDPHHAH